MRFSLFICVLLPPFFLCCTTSGNDHKKNGKFAGFELSESQKIQIKDFNVAEQAKVIDLNNADSEVSLSIIKDIEYIKLETKSEALIGEICKVKFFHDKIYILDNSVSKNLYIFSLDGKFVNKIRNFGEGPNEILSPYDFDISNNELVILDGRQSKFVYYDLTGIPKRQKRIFYRLQNFRFVGSERIIGYVGDMDNSHLDEITDYKVLLIDTSFNIKAKGFKNTKEEKENDYTLLDHLHNSADGRVIMSPKFKNVIYSFDSTNNASSVMRFDFKKSEIPSKYYVEPADKMFKYAKEFDKFFYEGIYQENEDCVYAQLTTPLIRNQVQIFVDKKSGKTAYGRMKPDPNGNVMQLGLPMSSVGNKFVGVIKSDNLMQMKEIVKQDVKIDPMFRRVIEETQEFDNPVIQLYSVRFENAN